MGELRCCRRGSWSGLELYFEAWPSSKSVRDNVTSSDLAICCLRWIVSNSNDQVQQLAKRKKNVQYKTATGTDLPFQALEARLGSSIMLDIGKWPWAVIRAADHVVHDVPKNAEKVGVRSQWRGKDLA